MIRTRHVLVAVCLMATRAAGQGTERSAAVLSVESFARNLAAADTVSLIRSFEPSVVLVQGDGSKVSGPNAVAHTLLSTRFGLGTYKTLFEPADQELCLDGAIYWGSYSTSRLREGGSDGVEAGSMAFRWTVRDGQGGVTSIALAANATTTAARRKLGASCARLDSRTLGDRRLEVTVTPISLGVWTGTNSLEDDLARRGWTRQPAIQLFTVAYSPDEADVARGGRKNPSITGIVGVSTRVAGHVRLSANLQPIASSFRLMTYNDAQSSRLTQDIDLRENSLEVVGDWRTFRLGVGPSLVLSSVHERYENLLSHDPVSGTPARASITDKSYSPRSLGVAVSAQFLYTISNRVSASVTGRYHTGQDLTVPGVPTHQNWSLATTGYYAGLSLAYAWW